MFASPDSAVRRECRPVVGAMPEAGKSKKKKKELSPLDPEAELAINRGCEMMSAAIRIQAIARGRQAREWFTLLQCSHAWQGASPEVVLADRDRIWRQQLNAVRSSGFVSMFNIKQSTICSTLRLTDGMTKLDVLRSGSPRMYAEAFGGHGPTDKELVGEIIAHHEAVRVAARLNVADPKTKAKQQRQSPQEVKQRKPTRRKLSRATPIVVPSTDSSASSSIGSADSDRGGDRLLEASKDAAAAEDEVGAEDTGLHDVSREHNPMTADALNRGAHDITGALLSA